MTRPLPNAPSSLLGADGKLHYGGYRGTVADFDPAVGIGRIGRLARKKGWIYLGVATERRYLGLAIVKLGYATSAFAYVLDHLHRTLIFDQSVVGLPTQATLATTTGRGAEATFRGPHADLSIARTTDAPIFRVSGQFGPLELDLSLDGTSAPPSLLAVHETPGFRGGPSLFSATEKRLALDVHGTLSLAGRRFQLHDAVGGYDFSFGYPPRHTRWNWSFLLGRSAGRPFGVNLVKGFVGAPECAAWYDGGLYPLAEGAFDYQAEAPEAPWTVTSGSDFHARFAVDGIHREEKNFGVLKSRFLQPVGAFEGALQLAGKRIEFANMLGVVEEQDVLW